MRDKYSPPQTGNFSEAEFAFLREGQSEVLTKIADVLKKVLPGIEADLTMRGLRDHGGRNSCIEATHLLDKQLKEAGLQAKILEGDLVVAPHETLEHRVNFVTTPEQWIIIDLSVDQIEKHKDKHILVKVTEPNQDALRKMLKEEYNWWFSEK